MSVESSVIPSDFAKKVLSGPNRDEILLKSRLELNSKCNLSCVHCYMRGWDDGEISTAAWKERIDWLASKGCFTTVITGGEPLLRPDFAEIYLYLKQKGFLVSVFTNGVLLSEKIIDLFEKWPPISVEISVYGATRETFAKVTGKPDLWEAFQCGLNRISKSSVPYKLKTTVLRENAEEVATVRDMAGQLGVDFRLDTQIHAARNGSLAPIKSRLSPVRAAKTERLIGRRAEYYDKFCDSFSDIPVERKGKGSFFVCNVKNGRGEILITPGGNLAVCFGMVYWRVPFNNGTVSDFRERMWKEFEENDPKTEKRFQECFRCSFLNICGVCTPEANTEPQKFAKPNMFLCHLNQKRIQLSRRQNAKKKLSAAPD